MGREGNVPNSAAPQPVAVAVAFAAQVFLCILQLILAVSMTPAIYRVGQLRGAARAQDVLVLWPALVFGWQLAIVGLMIFVLVRRYFRGKGESTPAAFSFYSGAAILLPVVVQGLGTIYLTLEPVY